MSVFSTPLCKKGGVTSVFKAGALSTLPLFSPFSMLCTLKAQVEAGVNHLNIYSPGFYSAAHLLNIYEWHPLNSF